MTSLSRVSRRGILLASLLLLGGCAGEHEARLRLEPVDRPVVYDQRFQAASYGVQPDGEYDVVLHNTVPSRQVRQGQPLLPAGSSAPQQFMHLRVAWRPAVGAKANHPAATNAIIDWYVIDDVDPHQPRYIHYQGAGLVRIYGDDQSAKFDIQPLTLSIRHQQGNLSDPFGTARLSGVFEAQRDSGRVSALLADLQATLAGDAAAAGGSPAAGSKGPQP